MSQTSLRAVPEFRLTMYDLAFVVVQTLDAVTMLLLPTGSEINPIAVANPVFAILMKMALVVFIVNGAFGRHEAFVVLIGIVVGAIGFGSNLSVLMAQ